DVMSQYGTDAFRFTLAAMAAMGRDIKLAEDRIAGYQNFVNKLWNAARFVQMNLGDADGANGNSSGVIDDRDLGFAERWIRSRLVFAIAEARNAIDSYRFNDYANVLYQFTWHEFCDWYIEMSKLALNSADANVAARSRKLLRELLDQILLLLHPVMPFVTEEIWQVLGANRESIMVQPYPVAPAAWVDAETEKNMTFLMDVTRAIRNLRTEMNCPPAKEVRVVFCGADADLAFLREQEAYLRSLARVGASEFRQAGDRPKGAATAVIGAMEVYLPLDDLVNLDEERARLAKEVGKVEDELARVQKKLANGDFLAKAKTEVVHKEREKATQFEEKIRTLRSSLEKIQEIQAGRS
ncbi:MAG TPA: class I tRNA ligase family protein, partial [Candidatus Binatia bacterium]|nr:class I tRNA ligase family protein [Candidatus Binatia bacterium]